MHGGSWEICSGFVTQFVSARDQAWMLKVSAKAPKTRARSNAMVCSTHCTVGRPELLSSEVLTQPLLHACERSS